MNPWPFVVAAYAIAIGLTAALLISSFASMRRAEAAADASPPQGSCQLELTRITAGAQRVRAVTARKAMQTANLLLSEQVRRKRIQIPLQLLRG